MKYHIWTIGCQMNVADSRRVASALESLNYEETPRPDDADVIVLNTCVVRQSAEDRAAGHLNSLRSLKKRNPNILINVMGCMVGFKSQDELRARFPWVDVFSAPSDPEPLLASLTDGKSLATGGGWTIDGEYILPLAEQKRLVAANISIVLGCSHACTFCVIPYRRGLERSRSIQEIIEETQALVKQGIKEVTLLGQIVDRYGLDFPEPSSLSQLLRRMQEIEGLERIRFLTSHPNWMTRELLETVAELSKVMPHIEVPVQAADNDVLERMRRGYTVEDYIRLIADIREIIPNVAIANDIIVGFPGETEEQFQQTLNLVQELRLDVVHLARYSERPGTLAARKFPDDVSEEEKWRRFRLIEAMQEQVAKEINATYLSKIVPVLFEEKVKGRWMGRTPTNKLTFVESEENLHAQTRSIKIIWTGSWSLRGELVE